MDLRLRSATAADIAIIAAFNRAMALETESLELDPERVEAGVRALFEGRGAGFYLLAEADGEVAGQLMVTYEWSDWRNGNFWWIQSVYVAPEHRLRGVFRALYAEVEKRAREAGNVCGIRLYVEHENHRAQRTYAMLGMRTTAYKIMEVDFVLGARS
ncbi:MAG: GNAT family N-acetyltransferase [Bryobacteraceae bacterium]